MVRRVGTLTDEPIVKMRILAAQQRMENGIAWFRRWSTLSWEDVEEFIGAAIRNPGDQDTLLAYVRERIQNPTMGAPAYDMALKDRLRKSFRRSFETDALSAMAATVVPRADGWFSWRVFQSSPLIANYVEGSFGRISGPPRKGKTNLACVCVEHWTDSGKLAIGNIRIDDGPENYIYVDSAKSLIRAAVEAKKARRHWLWILDEGALAGWTNQEWMTRRARSLNKFIRIVGKLRGNLIIVEQDPRAVPRLIVDWALNTYYVMEEGMVSIDLRGPNLVWHQEVRDFPCTRLSYDTRDWAAFAVDVDVDEMFQAVAMEGDQDAAILTYLDRPAPSRRRNHGPRVRDKEGRFTAAVEEDVST